MMPVVAPERITARLEDLVATLRASARATRAGSEPRSVHDTRVAARRIEAALDTFRDALPRKARRRARTTRWPGSLPRQSQNGCGGSAISPAWSACSAGKPKTKIWGLPSDAMPTKASNDPSGEIAKRSNLPDASEVTMESGSRVMSRVVRSIT